MAAPSAMRAHATNTAGRSSTATLMKKYGIPQRTEQAAKAIQARRVIIPLDLEPRVFEIQVALDAVHGLLVDGPDVAQPHDLRSLGFEDLAAQALVGPRALLDRTVVFVVEARLEAPDAELVQRTHAIRRLLADSLLLAKLLQPADRRLRRQDARLGLLQLDPAVLEEVQPADEPGQGQSLHDDGEDDDREGQEDDQVAVGELRERECGRERHGAAHPGPGHRGADRLP